MENIYQSMKARQEKDVLEGRLAEALQIAEYAVKVAEGLYSGSIQRDDLYANLYYIREDIEKIRG